MTFADVLEDIKKLIGLELQSIRPGANITIREVSEEKECLTIKTSQGQIKSRPLSELQAIWNELMKSSAVHVEGVLHGSGTSRNQPETILANLPYIEWLKIDNKKHIAYVGKNSHPYGTLKHMDAISADSIVSKIKSISDSNITKIVLVTNDITRAINQLQECIPGFQSTIEPGIYSYASNKVNILLLLPSKTILPVGYYAVIESTTKPGLPQIELCNEVFSLINTGGIKILAHSEASKMAKKEQPFTYKPNEYDNSPLMMVAEDSVPYNPKE